MLIPFNKEDVKTINRLIGNNHLGVSEIIAITEQSKQTVKLKFKKIEND